MEPFAIPSGHSSSCHSSSRQGRSEAALSLACLVSIPRRCNLAVAAFDSGLHTPQPTGLLGALPGYEVARQIISCMRPRVRDYHVHDV